MTGLALVAVAAITVIGLAITVRGMRPASGPASSLAGLRRYHSGSTGLGTAIIAALAAGSIVNPDHPYGAAVTGITVGAGLRLVVPRVGVLGDLALGLLGLVASLNTLMTTLAAEQVLPPRLTAWLGTLPAACSTTGSTVNLVAVLTLAGVFILAGVLAVLIGHIRFRAGLALFGSLDLLALLTSPLGVPIAGLSPLSVTAALVVAAILGAATAYVPDVVCTLVGVAVGAAVLLTDAVVPNLCTTTTAQLTASAAVLITWTLAGRLCRRPRA